MSYKQKSVMKCGVNNFFLIQTRRKIGVRDKPTTKTVRWATNICKWQLCHTMFSRFFYFLPVYIEKSFQIQTCQISDQGRPKICKRSKRNKYLPRILTKIPKQKVANSCKFRILTIWTIIQCQFGSLKRQMIQCQCDSWQIVIFILRNIVAIYCCHSLCRQTEIICFDFVHFPKKFHTALCDLSMSHSD